ncbi:MAG: ATP-binding protein [Oscillospiraceae bacterium]|nr:ATP-binding protein [Oscillospiraceae bacterium]
MKQLLPIGIDDFRKIRETGRYYVDKSLIIRDFLKYGDEVALITRPRRFGKTLNMTTIREFFDITADSRGIFEGLAIMDTEYASEINSRPVIYFTFKECKARNAESLLFMLADVVAAEYEKYRLVFNDSVDRTKRSFYMFYRTYGMLLDSSIDEDNLKLSISVLMQAVHEYYGIRPIVLIDEYDTPILSSVEYGFHDELKVFFSGFYGAALKGQGSLHQALLTGIQRIAKESIFSQLNNITVYTVADMPYSQYFGLTESEAEKLLSDYGLALDDAVKQQYDGYLFGEEEMYNPWSALNYAKTGILENYWINTSTNFLVRQSISQAGSLFRKSFDKLIAEGTASIDADLTCSFLELRNEDTLWGLLVNSGYITVIKKEPASTSMTVRIPNGEVRTEFTKIIAESVRVGSKELEKMFKFLLARDIDNFIEVYKGIVLSCTSYYDAKENAYHMLFLGMCISLNDLYKITSNIESGHGRSDIRMESLFPERPHIVIEFKQGEDVDTLKEEALAQILDKKYHQGLDGDCLCIGIAHNIKECAIAWLLTR